MTRSATPPVAVWFGAPAFLDYDSHGDLTLWLGAPNSAYPRALMSQNKCDSTVWDMLMTLFDADDLAHLVKQRDAWSSVNDF